MHKHGRIQASATVVSDEATGAWVETEWVSEVGSSVTIRRKRHGPYVSLAVARDVAATMLATLLLDTADTGTGRSAPTWRPNGLHEVDLGL